MSDKNLDVAIEIDWRKAPDDATHVHIATREFYREGNTIGEHAMYWNLAEVHWQYSDRYKNSALTSDNFIAKNSMTLSEISNFFKVPEYTGGSVNYYKVGVTHPTNKNAISYVAECNDIIEALGMNYAEGNAFKAIWRSCAARSLGLAKAGYKDGLYDAEKVVFFGQRMVEQAKGAKS